MASNLSNRMTKIQSTLLIAAATFFSGFSPAQAGDLDLTHVPLFLNSSLEPNIVVTFDDSGSMEWAFMPDAIFWDRNSNRAKSSTFNGVFYNPDVEYLPPLDSAGVPLADQSFTAASTNGYVTGAATVDLSTNYRTDWYYDGTDQEWADTAQAAYYYDYDGDGSITDDANYVYTQVTSTSGRGGTDERVNFANWYSYYRKRSYLAKAGATRSFGQLGSDIRVAWQNLNADTTISTMGRLEGTLRTDFFDFLYNSPAAGGTPLQWATNRVYNYYKDTAGGNPYEAEPGVDSREFSCRQSYHVSLTDGQWNSGSPGYGNVDEQSYVLPVSENSEIPSKSYDPNGAHTDIYGSAESDYLADLTFKMWAEDLRTDLDNNVSPFLSDTETGITGAAAVIDDDDNAWENDEVFWNPANNPATWQHVVNYNIGMGVNGARTVTDGDADGKPDDLDDLRKGDLEWGANVIDDLWHAAVNSRGSYFSAGDPEALVESFSNLLNDIIKRKGSASVTSVSSGVVTTGSKAFRTGFNSSDWAGNVTAYLVNSDGTLGDVIWDAACELDGGTCEATGTDAGTGRTYDNRDIITWNPSSETGVPFRYGTGALTSSQEAVLNGNTGDDALGAAVTNYIRGDRDNESQNGGSFRTRSSMLGDVIHSSAIFVGGPAAGYRDDWPTGSDEDTAKAAGDSYQAFRVDNQNRTQTVYVGGNDGMLHAFDSETGEELWAYIPATTFDNLPLLADPTYDHRSFVDATPIARDALINDKWRTVLLGTMRLGGQGVFALDITTPDCSGTNCVESSASSRVLWEFNDASSGGTNMGYTYGKPTITRAQNGKWVAIVPNGYNNQVADGNAGNARAVLFILDLETGAVVKEIDTGVGTSSNPNGLGGVVVADYESDFIADAVFAGDLWGNMWRFDISDADPSNWTVEQFFDPDTDGAQPITAPGRLGRDPNTGDLAVYFGTGKYIELSDRTAAGTPTQYFYGLRDKGQGASEYPIQRGDLVQQTISESGTARTVTNNPITSAEMGWEIALPTTGERQVTRALLRPAANRIIFATLIPNGDDPCLPGASGWLLAHSTKNGGPVEGLGAFDFNGDGTIDSSDDSSQVGLFVEETAWGLTPVMPPGGGQGFLIPGGDGSLGPVQIPEFEWRRRAWRRLFFEE